ncbi:MAG: hypothetical protein AB7I19_06750 [Planctomycetota bacterium]
MPKASTPAYQLLIDYLQRKPDASYAEIRDAAAKKNLDIAPVSYGRAKLQLGLVKQGASKKKAGKKGAAKKASAKASAAGEAPKKRGRPKGSKNKPKVAPVAMQAAGSVDDIVSMLRSMQRERDELRNLLGRIRGLLGNV